MKYLVYLLVPAVAFLLGCSNDKSTTPSVNQITGADKPIMLAPGGFKEFAFNIDLSSHDDAILRGEFSVTGAQKISVMVMTAADFNTWQNQGKGSMVYESGQVSAGAVDVDLEESGNYYLVFSNKSDAAKEKRVVSSIGLFFDVGDEF